jgi:hypothetical protein
VISRTCTFGDLITEGVLEIGDGYRAKNNELILGGDGPIFLRSGHVTDDRIVFDDAERFLNSLRDRVAGKTARVGDVIVTTKGWSTGRVSYVDATMPEFVYSPHLSYWRSRQHDVLQPAFLRQWSRSAECQHQIESIKLGIDIHPYLSLETQRAIRITLPTTEQQQAIAKILGTLDDKIELNRQMNETLEAIARALFTSWYSSQEPSAPEHSVEMLISERFLQVGDGYRAKNDELGEPGLPFARAANINNGFLFTDAELLRKDRIPLAGHKLSLAYDVVFTSKGTVGRFGFVPPAMGTFVYSPQLCFWRSLDRERLDPFVLRQWMESRAFLDQVDRVKGQTDMAPYVSLRDQRRMTVRLPTPSAQAAISHQLEALQRRVWHNVEETRTLVDLRDLLLPKLLSGELRIRDAEREVGQVA